MRDPYSLVGKTFAGGYQIEKVIGKGGMGVVYLVRMNNNAMPIAIKVMPPRELENTTAYQERVERFNREGDVALNHRHIVPVYTAGSYGEWHYLVMPYLDGGTLHDRRKGETYFSWREALNIMKQAAEAVDFIHDHGIVHRDIKPSNFIFNAAGELVLTDFGVAHVLGSKLTQVGEFWGTRPYASPEAVRGDPADYRDDIYSLGVVLNEMLTGNPPLQLRDPHPNKPPELEAVIQKATANRREERYVSAKDLVQALEAAIVKVTGAPTEHMNPPEVPLSYVRPSFITFLRRPAFPLVALIMILCFLLVYVISKTSTLVQPNTSELTSIATSALEEYYKLWNNREYPAAYNLLASDYQAQHPYKTLLPSYQHTRSICVNITDTNIMSADSVKVGVVDSAVEDNVGGSGIVTNHYQGYFIVRREHGQWKLIPHLRLSTDAQGSC